MVIFDDIAHLNSFLEHQAVPLKRIESYFQNQTADSVQHGFCDFCDAVLPFQFAVRENWTNLRNNFVCQDCGLNARQRMFIHVMQKCGIEGKENALIFERITPFFAQMQAQFPNVAGCEYFPDSPQGGMVERAGIQIRNENMLDLTYETASHDALLHQDVLEHVPDVNTAMRECARVLKPGGLLIFAAPIFNFRTTSRKRAHLEGRTIVYDDAPIYHGNPAANGGALVFTEIGQDMFDDMLSFGFDRYQIYFDHGLERCMFTDDNPHKPYLVPPMVVVATRGSEPFKTLTQ